MRSNMSTLTDLLAQKQPRFQTHQALLIVGLQNDFLIPEGRLPVDTKTGFLDRIQTLIPTFRDRSGNVIWVKTLYEADRIATGADSGAGDTLVVGGLVDGEEGNNEAAEEELAKEAASLPAQSRSSKHKQRALDLLKRVSARRKTLPKEVAKAKAEEDEELFLLKGEKRPPACVPNTRGAEFADAIAKQIELPTDLVFQTTHYSAFQGTDLLETLRKKLITEIFVCGCLTNVSVLASVIDAARHGLKICVLEDCIGFRKQNRHEQALRRMEHFFSAYLVNSEEILKEESQKLANKLSPPVVAAKSGQSREEYLAKMALGADIINRHIAQTAADAAKDKPELVKAKPRIRKNRKSKKKAREREGLKEDDEDTDGQLSTSMDHVTNDSPPPIAGSPAVIPHVSTDYSQPTSKIAKAGSVADLRDKEGKQLALKNDSSVPALSAKSGGEEEMNKLADSLDRVRMSPSSEPQSESGLGSKKGYASSAKAAQPEQSSSTQEADSPSTASPANSTTMGKQKLQSLATFPVLGPGDHIAEGDSRIIHDFFPADFFHPSVPSTPLKDVIFTQLYNEVRWQKMLHQQGEVPRLVCCQGEFGDDGSMPVYRHPADQTLPLLRFSPKVHVIRKQAQKLVGHPLNHVLIQLYRSGNDFISEHSDKTLDIVKGSSIVNVSFGSQRTMRLRTKKSQSNPEEPPDGTTSERETQRVALPHNSMFVLGLSSNAKWLHGIQPDKRLPAERSESETAYNGIRISLTFRHIGTYLDAHETIIWGQGATSKTQRDAAEIISNDDRESKRLITAFSRENHDPDFAWDKHYRSGFDVLHLHAPPPAFTPLLFLSHNTIQNNQVLICLSETKIKYEIVEPPALEKTFEKDRHVGFRDTDTFHSEIHTPFSILLYIDRYYPLDTSPFSNQTTANAYPTMLLASSMLETWQQMRSSSSSSSESGQSDEELSNLVARLEESVERNRGPFVAGNKFSIADAFVWPVVHVLVAEWSGWDEVRFERLGEWYGKCWRRKAGMRRLVERLAGEGRGKGKL